MNWETGSKNNGRKAPELMSEQAGKLDHHQRHHPIVAHTREMGNQIQDTKPRETELNVMLESNHAD
jgi:hypothetical protein